MGTKDTERIIKPVSKLRLHNVRLQIDQSKDFILTRDDKKTTLEIIKPYIIINNKPDKAYLSRHIKEHSY